jgi:hypothetical protein
MVMVIKHRRGRVEHCRKITKTTGITPKVYRKTWFLI